MRFKTQASSFFDAMNTNTSPESTAGSPESADVFDVRIIPGREKHARIFQRWYDLPVGGSFVLLNDHDPVPLYYQFQAQFAGAFSWTYLQEGPEEFRVRITKTAAVTPPPPRQPGTVPAVASKGNTAAGDGLTLQVDARGLEPPEPLVRILAALESLPAGHQLRAWTDREPCHLFGEARQRGFSHDCRAQADGSWITMLKRA